MKKPKFRKGDRVRRLGDFRLGDLPLGIIANCKYRNDDWYHRNPGWYYKVERKNNNIIFAKSPWYMPVKIPGNFSEEPSPPVLWVPQVCLKSAQPCPNCDYLGWDWVSGCDRCGLSPDDRE